MTPTLSTDDVEDRIRRTLSTRAEDVAPGDRQPGDDDSVLHLIALPLGTDTRGDRARGRRAVLAAAVLVVVIGAALSLVLVRGDDPTSEPNQAPTTDTAAPTETTLAPVTGSYPIGEFEGGGFRIHAQFEYDVPPEDIAPTDFWEPITAGPNTGFYAAMPDAGISELQLVFDDGVVVLRGGALPREDALAAGATVARDPATGRYTMPAPPGWTTVWTGEDTPPMDPTLDEPVLGEQPDSLGHFALTTDPGVNYGGIWYVDWTADNVAPNAEPVQVGDHEAYVGSIAPDAVGMLQLWIVYDDGVVELQAVGMTRDELITAATGVTRSDTGDFTITPAPGFSPA